MAQFTQPLFSSNFASGVTFYQDHYSDLDLSARVVLIVSLEDHIPVPVIVDTGAPWCVFNPELVRELAGVESANYLPEIDLRIRGASYRGRLYRLGLTLEADEGEPLEIDATVFVPTLPPDEVWPYPNFVGLEGFLSRIRFAVDPDENAFYFGLLGT